MRNLFLSLFIALTMTLSLQAQNPNYKTGITFKKLFLDYQSQNGGELAALRKYHSGYEIGVNYNLANSLNLVVPFHVGVPSSHVGIEDYHKTIFGLGAHIQYQFFNSNSQIVPYVVGGLNGVGENIGSFNLQAPIGFGLNFKVFPRGLINWETTYRKSFSDERDNIQHGIGFIYLLGNDSADGNDIARVENDSDNDGLSDELDLCPQVAGPIDLKGCPDSDGDGVADYEDACPSYAGLASLNGCPDSDNDGVSDKDDECPNLAGLVENKGCPSSDRDNDGVDDSKDKCPDLAGSINNDGCPILDADNDGVSDADDKCPNSPGPASTLGCPDSDRDGIADFADKCPNRPGISAYGGCPDTDGDGIDDTRDACPNSAGSVANNGCPEISAADRETLELAMRAVQFETGSATLKSESSRILTQISEIMNRYPDFNLSISGHTDNTGSATNNQRLSERRAQSCYDFLARAGISTSRMNFSGYGESRPIADNNTLRGKALNRRVEFNLIPR